MKKYLILTGFALSILINAQQTELIVNNYSSYDYRGVIIATGLNSCYPSVGNTYYPEPTYQPLKVIAGSPAIPTTVLVGKYNSGFAVPTWDVQSSATSPIFQRSFTHAQVSATSGITLGTEWHHSKFQMYYSGTNTHVPYTSINLSSGTNVCYTWPSYYTNPNTTLEAEWFVIGNYSYIQIY